MIISSATVRIMRSICNIFMKTLSVGTMTNCTQKNKGYGLSPVPALQATP